MSYALAARSKWHLVDARNCVVGRLATHVSRLLVGKHKPIYMPNKASVGDHVVVVNARDAVLTGNKFEQKIYYWHTGWPGGLKQTTPRHLAERKNRPEDIIERAVNGMLPKNKLRKLRFQRLHVFADEEHPFERFIQGGEPLVFEDCFPREREAREEPTELLTHLSGSYEEYTVYRSPGFDEKKDMPSAPWHILDTDDDVLPPNTKIIKF